MTEKDVFICYSPYIHKELKDNGIRFLATGLHETTFKKFWVYAKTEQVKIILDNNSKTD